MRKMPRQYSFCQIMFLLLLEVFLVCGRKQGLQNNEKLCCSDKDSTSSRSSSSKLGTYQRPAAANLDSSSKAGVGSIPPSCLNKCASCTPCQLVKALGDDKKIGSAPPTCNNKCNACVPCQAVQAPMTTTATHHRQAGRDEDEDEAEIEDKQGDPEEKYLDREAGEHFTVGFSNYMPETWKCKCGNQFFSP